MSDHKTATDRLIAAIAEIRDAITAQTEAIEEQTEAMWELFEETDEDEEDGETIVVGDA